MKKDYTHITMILDRSGSMSSVANDAIGGFNSFLEDQKKIQGDATLTLVQFDDTYEVLNNFVPIKNVNPLDSVTFKPRGTTALLDAIGRGIKETGSILESMSESNRPEKVVIVIITDGLENASRQFNSNQINEMIRHQKENYNWHFTFIGSNQDAITSAQAIGISAAAALTNSHNAAGVQNSYNSLSASIGNLRGNLTRSLTYSPEDRKKAFNK